MHTVAMDPSHRRDMLVASLNRAIDGARLVELHAHLMGMGSSDFWVSRIIGSYLPSATSDDGGDAVARISGAASEAEAEGAIMARLEPLLRHLGLPRRPVAERLAAFRPAAGVPRLHALRAFTLDVVYSEERLMTACGIVTVSAAGPDAAWSACWWRSRLEARLFDGGGSAAECIRPRLIYNAKKGRFDFVVGLSNSTLARLLSDEASSNRDTAGGGAFMASGPLRGVVRNWFEFLDPSGTSPSLPDIMDTCALSVCARFRRLPHSRPTA